MTKKASHINNVISWATCIPVFIACRGTAKAHDITNCYAVQRLTGVLVQYMANYNDALDCLKQNLQVQKTKHIEEVIKSIVSRIFELKRDIRKLEMSKYQFLSNALASNNMTMYDAELYDIPFKCQRSDQIKEAIDEAMEKAKNKREFLLHEEKGACIEEANTKRINWWEVGDSEDNSEENSNNSEDESVLSEESVKRKEMIDLIKSHEKSRQTLLCLTQHGQKRERWQKTLQGTLIPESPYKLKEKAARFIQTVIRAYFECKRQKVRQRQVDEMLGIKMSKKVYSATLNKMEEIREIRSKLKKQYDESWKFSYEKMKQNFFKRKIDEIAEDYRDFLRRWLREWFDQIQHFHDIPNKKEGGSALIIKGEISSPVEWLAEYEKYITEKRANRGKTPQEIKFEKMSIKREEMRLKKQIMLQTKKETELLKKMMKNPDMHPGYDYPESKTTIHILEAIAHYNSIWSDLDQTNTMAVKEKSVEAMDFNDVCTEVKIKAIVVADEAMRREVKKLKTALKEDYLRNDKKMLEPMRVKRKREKKKPKIKTTLSQPLVDELENLAQKGFIKECPKTKLQDFLGDPNFAGEEFRCNYEAAYPFNAETRDVWWEICRDMSHGFHKVLLVGPKGNGKTTLVHALANVNDAILFELDLSLIPKEMIIAPYLQLITNSVAACARAVQPSVIHIKHVQRLFYNRVPQSEADYNLRAVNTFWIKKLFRKLQKSDKITVIGTCIDPWLANSKTLLKQFPTVILLPNVTYSATVQLLNNWVIEHPVLPGDFDIQSLAKVLQCYSFGYLKKSLEDFMSAERTVKAAVNGLLPIEVYNYILGNGFEEKIDYEKYKKWYAEKTHWGRKEQKHVEEQREFKRVMQELAEKAKKKKQPLLASSASSSTHQFN
ncbi:hypothetical protein K1T71_005381 [Dendrolimus kikuchii]|uniref:Uncharacterized protein n=1 Tax=Dendrolimus kikuchii TaxID=765133 RepID=A0ACC1D3R4_9NEOP|nr:hypothetical protein K1T71_005381 [Dendrolimus kikuchii]